MTSSSSFKPILCLDFDGVLHSYTSGWKGVTEIPDPPVAGAMQFLREAVDEFQVAIFSSRSHQHGGIPAMIDWLEKHLEAELGSSEASVVRGLLSFPMEKPSALVTLDDRALTFEGSWPTVHDLRKFKPWNKR